MNYSKKRDMILRTLRKPDFHPTVETVYNELKSEYPKLSLATVYRNLNQLCEANTIKRLMLPNSPDRFDALITPHYHFYCNECNQVYNIEQCKQDCSMLLQDNFPHKITGYDVIFYGTCSECLNGKSL